jgi:hypothetical protein
MYVDFMLYVVRTWLLDLRRGSVNILRFLLSLHPSKSWRPVIHIKYLRFVSECLIHK